MYVISGQGELRIGDERFAVGPGDFAGFPPRTLAHHLRNTGAGDLVYLSGGEAIDFGIADFPDLGLAHDDRREGGEGLPARRGEGPLREVRDPARPRHLSYLQFRALPPAIQAIARVSPRHDRPERW